MRFIYCLSLVFFLAACQTDNQHSIAKKQVETVTTAKKKVVRVKLSSLDSMFHLECSKYSPSLNRLDSLLKEGAAINSLYNYTVSYKKLAARIPVLKDYLKQKNRSVQLTESPLAMRCRLVQPAHFNKSHYAAIEFLLKNKATFKVDHPSSLEQLLYRSASQYTAFDNALTAGKYINLFKKYNYPFQTLDLACTNGSWELIELLLQEGVPKKLTASQTIAKVKGSKGPWMTLLKEKQAELKKFEITFDPIEIESLVFFKKWKQLEGLLALGMPTDSRDIYKDIPLLFALIEADQIDMLKILIEKYKADPNIQFKGKSAIQFAKRHQAKKSLVYLQQL